MEKNRISLKHYQIIDFSIEKISNKLWNGEKCIFYEIVTQETVKLPIYTKRLK